MLDREVEAKISDETVLDSQKTLIVSASLFGWQRPKLMVYLCRRAISAAA